MLVSRQLLDHLPRSPEAEVQVVFPSGRHAFLVDALGLRSLCLHGMVEGEVNKRGFLKFVRLLVSVRAARKVQAACRMPSFGRSISKNRQARGAKTWVEHLERAAMRRPGGRTSLHMPGPWELRQVSL